MDLKLIHLLAQDETHEYISASEFLLKIHTLKKYFIDEY